MIMTLFSLVYLVAFFGTALAVDQCLTVDIKAGGLTGQITATVKGTLDTPANYAAVTFDVKFFKADGTSVLPASGAEQLGPLNLQTDFLSAGNGIDVVSTEVLNGNGWNMMISFPATDGTVIKCPIVCGVAADGSAGDTASCNDEECTMVSPTFLSGGLVRANVKGSLITAAPDPGATVTMTFTPVNDEAEIGPDEVEGNVMTTDFNANGVDVESVSGIAEGAQYTLVVSYPSAGWPEDTIVTCTGVAVTCVSDCYVAPVDDDDDDDEGSTATFMSASVMLLGFALISRAF